MARWMLSLGMLAAVALSQASRRRGLASGSGPPARAATVISRMIFVQSLPRLASCRPLRCWMFAHLLCPAIFLDILDRTLQKLDFTPCRGYAMNECTLRPLCPI